MRGNSFSNGPGHGNSGYNGPAGPYDVTAYGFALNPLPCVYDGLGFRWAPL